MSILQAAWLNEKTVQFVPGRHCHLSRRRAIGLSVNAISNWCCPAAKPTSSIQMLSHIPRSGQSTNRTRSKNVMPILTAVARYFSGFDQSIWAGTDV